MNRTNVPVRGEGEMKPRLIGVHIGAAMLLAGSCYAQEPSWDKIMSDASRAANSKQTVQAQQLYEKALAEAKKFGQKDPRLDKTLLAMERLYEDQKNWPAAEPYCRQVLSLREKTMGPDHLAYAQSVNNLAVLLSLQNKYAEAEQNYQKALKVVSNALGPQNKYSAMILENYAPMLRKINRVADAEKAEKQIAEIRNAERDLVVASMPAEAASATVGIGSTAAGRQGIVNEDSDQPVAATGANQIASVPHSRFFDQDVDEMLAMSGLSTQYMLTGDEYRDKKDFKHAEKLHKMALEAAQLSAGPKSMEAVLCMGDLALDLEEQNKFVQADPYFKRQVTVYAHMAQLDAWRLGHYAEEYRDNLRKIGNNSLADQVDQFVQNVDGWINDPSSRNNSYCAWLQEEKQPESTAFVEYQKELERRIKEHWTAPYGEGVGPPVVVFTIDKDGSISHLEMLHTSESMPIDQAALRAVSKSAPFPPLPPETSFEVQVEYTFDRIGKCVVHHQ